MKITVTYSEAEYEDVRIDAKARRVLQEFRDRMRDKVKYGQPNETEDYWYGVLFTVAQEEELDLWLV